MTDQTPSIDLSTLDGRRNSTQIELSDDGTRYECVRMFGAPPARVFQAFTDPADLRVWFPGGAPPGSEMTICESDPVEGGRYHYAMTIPGFGSVSWHGVYTAVDRPDHIGADEWFVMDDSGPEGDPTTQTLDFVAVGDDMTRMTMRVHLPAPEDPDEFMEQSAAGLSTSLAVMDELVSG